MFEIVSLFICLQFLNIKILLKYYTGQVDADTFFNKYTEDELLQTPRTPLELRQQQILQERLEQRREENQGLEGVRPPAVDVPIDVRRSLEALRDAMNRGDEVM